MQSNICGNILSHLRCEKMEFFLDGQRGWEHHDPTQSYGYFHTFDGFNVDGRPRKIHVLLPWEYKNSHTNHSYPVIYMNDGDTVFWSSSMNGSGMRVAQTLSRLQHNIHPVIIVAVHPLNRNQEYTHQQWELDDVHHDWGGLQNYSRYLAERVKPFFDKNYRTRPEAKNTAIVGASFGGLAAFYIGNSYPDSFGLIGCHSPAFWVGRDYVRDETYVDCVQDTTLVAALSSTFNRGLCCSQNKKTSNDATSDKIGAKNDGQGGKETTSTDEANIRAFRPRVWIDYGRADTSCSLHLSELAVAQATDELIALLTSCYDYKLYQDLFFWIDPIGSHNDDAWAYRFQLFVSTFFSKEPS